MKLYTSGNRSQLSNDPINMHVSASTFSNFLQMVTRYTPKSSPSPSQCPICQYFQTVSVFVNTITIKIFGLGTDNCKNLADRGDCEFYNQCVEKTVPCGNEGYAVGYGYRYCNRFALFYEDFTEEVNILD